MSTEPDGLEIGKDSTFAGNSGLDILFISNQATSSAVKLVLRELVEKMQPVVEYSLPLILIYR